MLHINMNFIRTKLDIKNSLHNFLYHVVVHLFVELEVENINSLMRWYNWHIAIVETPKIGPHIRQTTYRSEILVFFSGSFGAVCRCKRSTVQSHIWWNGCTSEERNRFIVQWLYVRKSRTDREFLGRFMSTYFGTHCSILALLPVVHVLIAADRLEDSDLFSL